MTRDADMQDAAARPRSARPQTVHGNRAIPIPLVPGEPFKNHPLSGVPQAGRFGTSGAVRS